MKIFFSVLLFCIGVVLISCDPNAPTLGKVATQEASEVTDHSAKLHGLLNVDPNGYGRLYCGVIIAKTSDEIKERKGKYYESMSLDGKDFVVNVVLS